MATPLSSGLSGRLTIDLGALKKNWRALDKVSAGALTGAAVKADAYGMGIPQVARALMSAGARFFFVATVDEALALRAVSQQAHIFVLNGLYPGAADLYVRQNLMPVLNSVPMLEEWLDLCVRRGEAYAAALHFDTGMNRLGFRLNEAARVREMIEPLGFSPQMVMSHFACADQPHHEKNRTQLALFNAVIAQFPNVPASIANSAALMTGRENHFQMVRPGISLYGGRAVIGRQNPMAPVAHLEVPILQVREGKTGETVGYGAMQTLTRDSRLAILSVGYADGFLRALGSTNTRGGGKVAIKGRLAPIVGRISMDLTIVDVTDFHDDMPKPGDMVEVFGRTITVDEQAEAAGTIGYELLTGLTLGRYRREYVGGDES